LVLDELTKQLIDAGFATDTARKASTELPLDEDCFLNFTARTVFGVNPAELGSPFVAAFSSLALFSVGALVPLLPWFFAHGTPAACGRWHSLQSPASSSVAWSAVRRQLRHPRRRRPAVLIVILASAVTYGIGSLFGTAVA
jgi:vacuolar iron transporter family protein